MKKDKKSCVELMVVGIIDDDKIDNPYRVW